MLLTSRLSISLSIAFALALRISRSLRSSLIFFLYSTAQSLPEKDFKVAYRNTSKPSLNGYTGYEMMEMFLAAGEIPKNVWFSSEWVNSYIFKDKFTSVELI